MNKLLNKYPLIFALMLMLALMLFFGSNAMAATETPTADPLPWLELLAVVIGGDKAALVIGVIGLIGFVLTHIMAWLPVEFVAKWPNWLITAISCAAGNYKGAANESDFITKRDS